MFKLIKFSIFAVLIVAVFYGLLGLSFGDKTLYQHLVTIAETDEAKALKLEIDKKIGGATKDFKQKAKKMAIDHVKKELETVRKKRDASNAESDPISAEDKASLDALIEEKQSEHLTADRRSLDRLIRKKMEK
jgi:hypothetical protein